MVVGSQYDNRKGKRKKKSRQILNVFIRFYHNLVVP